MTPSSPKVETVLLVDDNEGDRKLISMALKENGYKVLEAGSGREALEIFQGGTDAIDLILTDIIMPEMDGVQLVERIRRISRGTRVIFVSSYKQNKFRDAFDVRSAHFVEKSGDYSGLVEKVREVLDGTTFFKRLLKKIGFS